MKIKQFLKSVFIGDTAPATPPAPITEQQIEEAIAELREHLHIAKCAQRAHVRRITTFGLEHPELHKLYFTKAGDAMRKEATRAAA